jgi:hypothetical protein
MLGSVHPIESFGGGDMAKGKSDGPGSSGYKLLTSLGAATGAFVARKLMSVIWKAVTGRTPPDKPESLDVDLAEAVAWAVVSGAAVGVARVLAQRRVTATWHKANGDLPEGVDAPASA